MYTMLKTTLVWLQEELEELFLTLPSQEPTLYPLSSHFAQITNRLDFWENSRQHHNQPRKDLKRDDAFDIKFVLSGDLFVGS
jgi:hypothetical protein